jgi:hypothetical protein
MGRRKAGTRKKTATTSKRKKTTRKKVVNGLYKGVAKQKVCLEKKTLAQIKKELKDKMESGIVEFVYTYKQTKGKVGTKRRALGTLNKHFYKKIGEPNKPKGVRDTTEMKKRGMFIYFDINRGNWRTFDLKDFVEIKNHIKIVDRRFKSNGVI